MLEKRVVDADVDWYLCDHERRLALATPKVVDSKRFIVAQVIRPTTLYTIAAGGSPRHAERAVERLWHLYCRANNHCPYVWTVKLADDLPAVPTYSRDLLPQFYALLKKHDVPRRFARVN